jgi:hypothetical protein
MSEDINDFEKLIIFKLRLLDNDKFRTRVFSVFLMFRIQWMMGFQGMVCLAGNQVWWTWEVEDVFQKVRLGQKQAMKEYARKQHKQIDDLVVQVSNPSLFSSIG